MCYAVLVRISPGYPPAMGRLHTCYSPVRRSPAKCIATFPAAPRLACVKPVASVHPEPGSNSSLFFILFLFLLIRIKGKTFLSVCLKQHSKRDSAPPMNRLYCVQISKLTESKFISFCSCTTFVYCKTINVRMLLGFEPKAMTKLRTIFQLTKFFVKKI